ncbi:NfeD family protein [Woeseia oceani]|nr:NfeD family protein [Woeseia oceani]
MAWWAWMILGAVLFGAEMLAVDAQFYLVFIGLSAALVGVLALLGLTAPEWLQWLIFAGLALGSMFTFRRKLYEKIRGNVPGFKEGIAGEYIVIDTDLAVGAQGRTQFRGTDWTVVNSGGTTIAAGSRVPVTRNEGLTLYVSADPSPTP